MGALSIVAMAGCAGPPRNSHSAAPLATTQDLEQRALEHPDSFDAQLALGISLVKADHTAEAEDALQRARRLAPNDPRPPAWLGEAAFSQHRNGDARKLFSESLHRDSSNTTALRGLANLDAQEKRLRPAIHGFERLVKLQPNDADAWQRLGLLLIGVRENYRSFDALSHAAALDPKDVMTQRALGNMALHANRLETARTAFRSVLAIDPRDPQSLAGLATTTIRLDPSPAGIAEAEREADMAVSAAPSALAFRSRGEIYMVQRRWSDAIRDLNASIDLEPNHRNSYVMLSQCYAAAGKPDLAKAASQRFEQLTEKQLSRDRSVGPRPESLK